MKAPWIKDQREQKDDDRNRHRGRRGRHREALWWVIANNIADGLYFRDRVDAGRQLARRLETLDRDRLIALGLPRGGVVIASEVAAALEIPLDVVVVRKLGVPFQPELAMGAIGEDGVRVIDQRVVGAAGIRDRQIQMVEERERLELARRARMFRGGRPRLDLTGATALILDDGIATGSTARAAVEVAKKLGAARVVVAAPVTSVEAVRVLSEVADQVVYLTAPPGFLAIGEFYSDFSATSDTEVVKLLGSSQTGRAGAT
jgi:putative phosphoribosyl transferase